MTINKSIRKCSDLELTKGNVITDMYLLETVENEVKHGIGIIHGREITALFKGR